MDQATPSSSGIPEIAEADGKDATHLDTALRRRRAGGRAAGLTAIPHTSQNQACMGHLLAGKLFLIPAYCSSVISIYSYSSNGRWK